jgi:putative DNA-invertase from lambdoid prophage Rac
MKEFVHFLSDMDDIGIGVIAVKNGLDTSSSSGRMMMKLIGVLEEWNREMLIERTRAGLARTVANGTKLGRRKVTNDTMTAKIIELRTAKKSLREIASEVGVSRGTVNNVLKAA